MSASARTTHRRRRRRILCSLFLPPFITVAITWCSAMAFAQSRVDEAAFQETPNLYFVSFDSMAPRALLEKHLGIENTRFHDVFAMEFRRFPNFFVNAVHSFNSINMLMSLDEHLFFSVRSSMSVRYASMFSGSIPSPLLRVLRDNGYETNALYNDTYFGYPKGPHIDNYFVNLVDGKRGHDNLDFYFDSVNGRREGGVCTVKRELPDYDIGEIRTGQFIPGEGNIWAVELFLPLTKPSSATDTSPERSPADAVEQPTDALGDHVYSSDFDLYLDESSLVYVRRQCEPEDVAPLFFLHVVPKDLQQGEFLLDKLTNVSGDRPQFMIAHLYLPGHTQSYFRYEDQDHRDEFKSFYTRGSSAAAGYLQAIVDHLKRNDPRAILFVYGDHGPLLSRGIPFDEDPEFVVQDNFGALGGVYPRDRCAAYFDAAEQQGYLTVLDAVHAILGCLSGGQSVLVGPRQNRLGGFGGVPLDSGYTYEGFLYE